MSPWKHPGTLSIHLSLRNPGWLYLGGDCVLPIDRRAQLCYFYLHPGNCNVYYEDKNLSYKCWGSRRVCMFATFVRWTVSQDSRGKTAENKKKKDFGAGSGCWGLPSKTGTKLVDRTSCRTPRSNALWAVARFSGIIQAFLAGSLYLITCDRAAPCVGIQPLRSSGGMKENCSLQILIFRWDELWQYLCIKMSRALMFCCRCWVFVSLSTSTDDGLFLTKRSPVLCNPWIREVWVWFLKWILYVEQLLWSAPCAPVYTEATTHTATSFYHWSQLCRCSTPCSHITCYLCILIISCRHLLKRYWINRISKSTGKKITKIRSQSSTFLLSDSWHTLKQSSRRVFSDTRASPEF